PTPLGNRSLRPRSGNLIDPPLVLGHRRVRFELSENLNVLQGLVQSGLIRAGRNRPRPDQGGTGNHGQSHLLGYPERAPVVGGYHPVALLGEGQTHRLTVGAEQRSVVGVAVQLWLVLGVADREQAWGDEARQVGGNLPPLSRLYRVVLAKVTDLFLHRRG